MRIFMRTIPVGIPARFRVVRTIAPGTPPVVVPMTDEYLARTIGEMFPNDRRVLLRVEEHDGDDVSAFRQRFATQQFASCK